MWRDFLKCCFYWRPQEVLDGEAFYQFHPSGLFPPLYARPTPPCPFGSFPLGFSLRLNWLTRPKRAVRFCFVSPSHPPAFAPPRTPLPFALLPRSRGTLHSLLDARSNSCRALRSCGVLSPYYHWYHRTKKLALVSLRQTTKPFQMLEGLWSPLVIPICWAFYDPPPNSLQPPFSFVPVHLSPPLIFYLPLAVRGGPPFPALLDNMGRSKTTATSPFCVPCDTRISGASRGPHFH